MDKYLEFKEVIDTKAIRKHIDQLIERLHYLEHHPDKNFSKSEAEQIELNLESIIDNFING